MYYMIGNSVPIQTYVLITAEIAIRVTISIEEILRTNKDQFRRNEQIIQW